MNNSRFDLPARNSIPVNEPGSAAYRRLQRAKKGRPMPGGTEKPWGPKKDKTQQNQPDRKNLKNVQRRVKGKQR